MISLFTTVSGEPGPGHAQLAQYAQRMSEDSWSVTEDAEAGGGSISGSLGELTRQSATLLADIVWHPYRKRRSVGRDLVKLHADLAALRKNGAEDDGSPWGDGIPWNTALF
jgi:hypothetical protein